MRRIWLSAAAVLVCGIGAAAQDASKPPSFEVATIRPIDPNAKFGMGGFMSYPGGRVAIGYASVKMLMYYAFDVQQRFVLGGPDWAATERYNITAVPPDDAESRTAKQAPLKATPSEEQRKMIESLLVERFGLKWHREQKEMPVYFLERGSGKLGLLPPKNPNSDSRGQVATRGNISSGEAFGENLTMEFLARQLGGRMDRPVLDRTGLAGHYDFQLGPVDPENTDFQLAAFGAMTRLGLKLKPGKGMVDTIVIDSVTRPTEN